MVSFLYGRTQNISGQWKGSFNESSGSESTEYILELEVKGKTVEGTSITYFTLNGKKYFTMCAVSGSYDPDAKTIISKEISKVKANTPDWFRDCFQTHTLTYFKKGDEEQLSGTWKSAKREENCGKGNTLLSRKLLVRKQTASPTPSNRTAKENLSPKNKQKESVILAEENSKKLTPENNASSKKSIEPKKEDITLKPALDKLAKRSNKVFESFELTEEDIHISIYDNAEIDGDVITVIFNDEIVILSQTLSDKPIQLTLKAKKGTPNTLTMYAENQGKVPPNTAIMRIQNGNTYHKVLLSADDKQNASVVFNLQD